MSDTWKILGLGSKPFFFIYFFISTRTLGDDSQKSCKLCSFLKLKRKVFGVPLVNLGFYHDIALLKSMADLDWRILTCKRSNLSNNN